MASHPETLWPIEAHTKAKHDILRRYLGAWFAILGARNPRVVYIDGFCGPGRYAGGEDGSPLIALKQAQGQRHLEATQFTFIFIDHRADRIEHLEQEIASFGPPSNFTIHAIVKEFEDTLERTLAPTFAFIDPFGFKGAGFQVVRRLLDNQRTEIFINIMADAVIRFLEHPDQTQRDHITSLLGATQTEIGHVAASPDRKAAIRELYLAKLQECAKFVRFFSMCDDRNKEIYDLFFASNHRLGHKKMKEAFWKVDPLSGFKFSDRTDAGQPVLFDADPSSELAKHLSNRFRGHTIDSRATIEFVEDHTAFINAHARKALSVLEEAGRIQVEPKKADGKKRKAGTFPPGVTVRFLE
jgi:three-Cys-motif partner protein